MIRIGQDEALDRISKFNNFIKNENETNSFEDMFNNELNLTDTDSSNNIENPNSSMIEKSDSLDKGGFSNEQLQPSEIDSDEYKSRINDDISLKLNENNNQELIRSNKVNDLLNKISFKQQKHNQTKTQTQLETGLTLTEPLNIKNILQAGNTAAVNKTNRSEELSTEDKKNERNIRVESRQTNKIPEQIGAFNTFQLSGNTETQQIRSGVMIDQVPVSRIKVSGNRSDRSSVQINFNKERTDRSSGDIFEKIKMLNHFVKNSEPVLSDSARAGSSSVNKQENMSLTGSNGKVAKNHNENRRQESSALDILRTNDTIPQKDDNRTVTGLFSESIKTDHSHRTEKSEAVSRFSEINKTQAFDDIVNKTKIAINNGETRISSMMRPEHLGRVDFNITVKDGRLNGRVVLQTQEAADFFRANIEDLKAVFQKSNVELGNIDVMLAGSNMGQSSGSDRKNRDGSMEFDMQGLRVQNAATSFENNSLSQSLSGYGITADGVNLLI